MPAAAVIEDVLRHHLGERVRVAGMRQIRPWTVARCRLEESIGPASVIVKWLRANPQSFRVDRGQIGREAAALALLERRAPGVGPRLIAFDPRRDLLVTEDLAPRRTLHSLLATGLRADPAGVVGLHTFAATMGRLHAATAANPDEGPWDGPARVVLARDDAAGLLERLDDLVAVRPAVQSDARAATGEIDEPGDLAAFSNGDSGANNCLVGPDGRAGRLIDFEHACRRHVLLDAVALHVPGSMWMTLADPIPLGVEATYRTAAGSALPGLIDDARYGVGLSAASAVVAIEKLQRFEKLDAREPGHHSRAQLVVTLERAVATMGRFGDFEALAGWLAAAALALRRRWPDADRSFPDDYTLREPFTPDH